MTLAMELKRQRQEGIAEGTRNMILAMLQKGFSAEIIADCAQTSVEYIIELARKIICCDLNKASARAGALFRIRIPIRYRSLCCQGVHMFSII